jgi:hypothetical protein
MGGEVFGNGKAVHEELLNWLLVWLVNQLSNLIIDRFNYWEGLFILNEEPRLRVFANKWLSQYLDQRKTKQKEDGENYIRKSFIICSLLQIL